MHAAHMHSVALGSFCVGGLASARRSINRRSRHVVVGPLNSNDCNCHIYQAAGRDRRQRQDRAECEVQAVIATDCAPVYGIAIADECFEVILVSCLHLDEYSCSDVYGSVIVLASSIIKLLIN
jgi:hypothetical protein